MDYNVNKIMKVDFLKLAKLFSCDIFEYKVVKILLVLLLLIHGGLGLVQTYFIVYIFNSQQFASYGPFFFGIFFSLGGVAMALFKNDYISHISDEMTVWDMDAAGPEIRQRIKKESRVISMVLAATFLTATAVGSVFVLPTSVDYDRFFAIKLATDYCPKYSTTLSYLYKLTLPFIAYATIVPCANFIYYSHHMRFQLMMLSKHVQCLTEQRNKQETDLEKLIYDESYQKEFSRRIIFCIQRHNEIICLGNKKQDEMNFLIGYFALTGCGVGISIILFVIMFSGLLFQEKLMLVRITLLSMISGYVFSLLILSGQAMEEETDRVSEMLLNVDWYLLNPANKRTYVIFLINTMVPWRLQFLQHSINLELGVNIGKQIYGIGSVLLNLRSRFISSYNSNAEK
ncbi:uncharacterized protein LOC135131054 [Zophobas morio]|uniref:uncharacterized protein LOC135131054 n=1 Tax=Zophobas morio TaxID=2755281 RepID=UPI003083E22E